MIEGSGDEPTPGSTGPLKAEEFIPGYPDEEGVIPNLPQPGELSRNGAYTAYRRLQEHLAMFRNHLAEHADTPDAQELPAAELTAAG